MVGRLGIDRRTFTVGLALSPTLASNVVSASSGKEFRFSYQADAASLDPLFMDEAFTYGFLGNIYEGLTGWSDAMEAAPALAESWTVDTPTSWTFKLRPNVKFHDGSLMTSDDVLFSLERYLHPESIFRSKLTVVSKVEAVDPLTVRFTLASPAPIFPRMLIRVPIMNRAWAVKNGAERPSNSATGVQSYAADNANGTGPFKIVERTPDVRTILEAHKDWWDKPQHNLSRIVFQPIKSPGTRAAALLSNQIDMMWPVPLSDIPRLNSESNIAVDNATSEWVIMFRYNFGDAELRSSNVKGRNPFHDPRVREAIYLAVDVDAINRAIMRGLARPSAQPIAPTINGFDPALDKRPKADLARAKKLLAEAGYPDGFSFAVHVPNDRYINDEAIGAAVVSMLARVGIKASLVSQSRVRHFAAAARGETDFHMTGFASAALKDGYESLAFSFHTRGQTAGNLNYGKYSNPRIDELAELARTESDPAKRREYISEGMAILQKDWVFVPLHVQPSVWAMRKGCEMLHLADDTVRLWRVKIS